MDFYWYHAIPELRQRWSHAGEGLYAGGVYKEERPFKVISN